MGAGCAAVPTTAVRLFLGGWGRGSLLQPTPRPSPDSVFFFSFFLSEPNVFHRPVTKIKAGWGLLVRLRRSASHSLASSGKHTPKNQKSKNTRLPQAGQRPRLAVVFTPTQYIQCRHKYIKCALELHLGRGEGKKCQLTGKQRLFPCKSWGNLTWSGFCSTFSLLKLNFKTYFMYFHKPWICISQIWKRNIEENKHTGGWSANFSLAVEINREEQISSLNINRMKQLSFFF